MVAAKDELAIVCNLEGNFNGTVVKNKKDMVYVE